MGTMLPGDALLDIVRSVRDNLVIVAPYIKTATLRSVIEEISSDSTPLTCVTRWLPQDIAAGVCDLEILDIITEFPRGKLLVHPHLHAKYYRGDRRCLVGSANLTSRGLGWTTPANVELLVELPADFNSLREWETALLEAAIPATQELKKNIRREADRLIADGALSRPPEVDQSTDTEALTSQWVPRCPVPDRLWDVCCKRELETMITTTRQTAQEDLAALAVPIGLTKSLFEAYIIGILKQMPLIVEIDDLASHGLSDSQARRFLEDRLGDAMPYPVDETWRILKTWLTYFLSQTYRLEVRQEVLVKGQSISGLDES